MDISIVYFLLIVFTDIDPNSLYVFIILAPVTMEGDKLKELYKLKKEAAYYREQRILMNLRN